MEQKEKQIKRQITPEMNKTDVIEQIESVTG